MSSQWTRWTPALAVAAIVPALLFVAVNTIEWLAGNEGGEGVFGTSLEPWRGEVEAMVGAGPFVALALVLAAAVRVDVSRTVNGFDAHVRVRMSRRMALLFVVSGLLALGVAGYLLTGEGALSVGPW